MQTHIVPSSPQIAVDVAGSGPLVILVHGMGGDRAAWHHQLAALQSQFTTVSIDLRGYGDSGDISAPLDFRKDFCADLCAVMDYFKVTRSHLVGLSMGGRVARSAALLMPQRVASLTLANTSPGFDAMTEAELEKFVQERSKNLSGETPPAGFGLQQVRNMVAPDADAAAIDCAAKSMDRLRLRNYLEVLHASTLQDSGARLEDIHCPTQVITGGQDRVYPERITAQLQKRIPGARLNCIPGAGHLSNLEQPEAFNSILLEFLNSLPLEPAAIHPER